MFYVAMTRARHHLHIYYVKERFNKEVDASRFVEEIVGRKLKKDKISIAPDKVGSSSGTYTKQINNLGNNYK